MSHIYRAKPVMDPLERQLREDERRAARFEARKPRVLHAKTRLIGLDTQALAEQVKEKAMTKQAEMERDIYYDEITNVHARILTQKESERQYANKQRAVEVDGYRLQQQAEKERDLQMSLSQAGKYKDTNSPFLTFKGDDLNKAARTKAQHEQQQDWLSQQVRHFQAREDDERRRNDAYHDESMRVSAMRKDLEERAAAQRRQDSKQHLIYNQDQAVQKKFDSATDKRREDQLAKHELDTQMNSAFLNDAGDGSFKGFTPNQRAAILEEQRRQIAELNAKRLRERREHDQDEASAEGVRRAMVIKDRASGCCSE